MKIIDWYILKRYLVTFFMMIILFIPIGIIIDLSEKVDEMIERKAPLNEILLYYVSFIIYFANILFPILLFFSIIWFTSKLYALSATLHYRGYADFGNCVLYEYVYRTCGKYCLQRFLE